MPGHSPAPGPHEVQQPGNQLPCAQGADALRTGASEEPTVALPWGTLAWKCPSTWPLAFSPHYVLLSGHPSQPCSGHPCEPIFCQTLRPLSLKAIHGLGLHTPGYRYKFTGTLEEDSPRHSTLTRRWPTTALKHPSCTRLGPGCAPASAFSGLLRSPSPPHPGSASSAVTISRGAQPPRPHLLSLRAARYRRVARSSPSRPRPAPQGSAGIRCAPRASTRMDRCRPPSCWPHPRPAPAPRPARPGEKALIGKIAQEPGGGARGRAVSSSARAAWRRPPPSMSSPPGEDCWGDEGEVCLKSSRGPQGPCINSAGKAISFREPPTQSPRLPSPQAWAG